MKQVIFFDIDGTLLKLAPHGRDAFIEAAEMALNIEIDPEELNFSGATDLQVLGELAAKHGVLVEPERLNYFKEIMARRLNESSKGVEADLYPGVHQLLENLADLDGVLLGIVTGNIESCAAIKLDRARIKEFFDLGGFGDDSADRRKIAAAALGRARDYAELFGRGLCTDRPIVLIGDTPNDIAAAKAIGARAIAVATGKHSMEELAAKGAEHVFENFNDLERVLQAILSPNLRLREELEALEGEELRELIETLDSKSPLN